ncbi:ATP-dependent DNA helicase RRM3-like [Rutidosis leptorrhynchoides]|uniref:ATP-dependent DNA helicase RRM3-like n=1 Tax=Rutidosis leptorrhynchoides TaxID=125765 RepID=UPI003A99A75D
MSDDIPLRAAATLNMPSLHINDEDLHNYVLFEVEVLLNQYSKSISDYALPTLPADLLVDLANRLIMEEKNYNREALDVERLEMERSMNSEQKQVYQLALTGGVIHGGTGKTFLWKSIITALRARGKIVLVVASSSVASLLLPSERTAHSRFKLPLDPTDESMCNIKKNTQMAKLIKSTDLIVWDEAPMNEKRCFEALDRSLRDILENNSPFGGKSFILGGDFKQTLPVKKKGSKSDILRACITTSYLWRDFKVFVLTQNMRLLRPDLSASEKARNEEFSRCLLSLENGLIGTPESEDPHNSRWKAIVCPKNDDADAINKLIVDMVDGPVTTCNSYDSATPHANDGGAT